MSDGVSGKLETIQSTLTQLQISVGKIEKEEENTKTFMEDMTNNTLPVIFRKIDKLGDDFRGLERKVFFRLPVWATLLLGVLMSLVVGLIVKGVYGGR